MGFLAAIPALASLGGSLFGGISGKKAAKEQKKMTEKYMNMLQPLIQAQIQAQQAGLATGQDLVSTSKPWLQQGATGMSDMLKFWQPLLSGNRSAIDQFFAPERRAINQGYDSSLMNLAQFAPRGGGRVSAMAAADRQRQGQLSDLVFGGRREAAGQTTNLNQMLAQLGLGGTQAGIGAMGNTGSGANNLYGFTQGMMGRSDATAAANAGNWGQIGSDLGGFLGKMFPPKDKK